MGATDGAGVGIVVGVNVGSTDGAGVGIVVCVNVGCTDGAGVGIVVGVNVGSTDGTGVGIVVGVNVGATDGGIMIRILHMIIRICNIYIPCFVNSNTGSMIQSSCCSTTPISRVAW